MTIPSQSGNQGEQPQGEAFMTTADGRTVPAPPDLPARITVYRAVIEVGRHVAAALASVDLAEVRATRELIAPAVAEGAYAPGGELHCDDVTLRALEAFAAVLTVGRGEAATADARAAAQRVADARHAPAAAER